MSKLNESEMLIRENMVKLKVNFTNTDIFQFKKSCTEKLCIPREVQHTAETFMDAFNKELKI